MGLIRTPTEADFVRVGFKLEIGGRDVSAMVQDRLISLTLTDNDGWESDSLTLDFDNRDNRIPLPTYQQDVKLWLPLKNQLVYMGLFKVSDSTLTLRPRQLNVTCTAADLTLDSLKSTKTRGWNDKTLGDIARAIAAENKLKVAIADELAAIKFPQVDQTNESDINLLNRLGKDFDATVKIADGTLLFTLRGVGQSVSGQAMPAIVLNEGDCQAGVSIKTVNRQQYNSVACEYREVATGEAKVYRSGTSEPVLTIKGMMQDLEQAKARVNAYLRRQQRSAFEINFTTVRGDPRLVAGAVVQLGTGFHPDYDGASFVIASATHQLSGAYTTACQGSLKVE